MTTTSIRFIAPSRVNRQGNRHRDELDSRNAGQGVIKGIAFGGPLGGLLARTGALLAGIIIGLVAGIVLGAFGGLYRQVRSQEDADAHPTRTSKVPQPLQRCSVD
jgi:hypothetical protein